MDLISIRADIEQLALEWKRAKETETDAAQERREVEDEMVRLLEINSEREGTVNFDLAGYEIKIVSRFNRKVDTDLLQQLSAEFDLEQFIYALFRWKADVDMKAWKASPDHVTKILSQAVTTTAGRPSFSITKD